MFENSPIRAWAKDRVNGLEVLNSLAYAVMFSVAQKQLTCGNSVVVDCPLARQCLYEQGRALALQVGVTCTGLESSTAPLRCSFVLQWSYACIEQRQRRGG